MPQPSSELRLWTLPTALTLIRGTNIGSKPPPAAVDVWDDLWTSWDWAGWMKPNIDRAIALGSNCFRFFGTVSPIVHSELSLATYLNQWRQLLDYTASQGAMFVPCGSRFYEWMPDTTFAQAIDIYSELGAMLAAEYPASQGGLIPYIDLSNEPYYEGQRIGYGHAVITGLLSDLATALRDAGCTHPIGVSQIIQGPSFWPGHGPDIASFVDVFDWHFYRHYPAASDMADTMAAAWAQKPHVIGEFGCNRNDTGSGFLPAPFYNSIKNMLVTQDMPTFLYLNGAMQWSVIDQDTVDSNRWGMTTADGTLWTTITDVFATFPDTRPT